MNPIIKRIIAGTRKYKNLVTNGNLVDTTGWQVLAGQGSIGTISNVLTATYATSYPYVGTNVNWNIPSGKKIYLAATLLGSKTTFLTFRLFGTFGSDFSGEVFAPSITTSFAKYSAIITTDKVTNGIVFGGNNFSIGEYFQAKEVIAVALPDIFGKGNEPNLAWCDANIPRNIIW